MASSDGQHFLSIEDADMSVHPLPSAIFRKPHTYVQLYEGAALKEDPSIIFEPGLFDISSFTGMCHAKIPGARDELLCKQRANLLNLINTHSSTLMNCGVYMYMTSERLTEDFRRAQDASVAKFARLAEYTQNRLTLAMRTTPIDEVAVAEAARQIYSRLNLAPPRVVVVPNPLVGEIAAGLSACILGIGKYAGETDADSATAAIINDEVYAASVKGAEWISSESLAGASREEADKVNRVFWAENGVRRLLRGSTVDWEAFIGQLPKIKEAINTAVGAAVDITQEEAESYFQTAFAPSMMTSVFYRHYRERAPVVTKSSPYRDAVFYIAGEVATEYSDGDSLLSGLMYDCVLELDRKATPNQGSLSDEYQFWAGASFVDWQSSDELFQLWLTLSTGCSQFWLHEDFCIVTDFPEIVRLDDLNRLHSDSGPAVRWRDGSPFFFFHGIPVTMRTILAPDTLGAERILAEDNIEIRRVMMSRYGEGRFMEECGALKIHEDEFGTLYSQSLNNDEPLVMVKVKNSTAEPDGTFKYYYLRVPPEMRTARAAVAWSFDLRDREYSPDVQS
jgi:hypothetical protein